MPRRPLPRPTDAELAILRVLWSRGPSTVREVHDQLSTDPDKAPAYTTTLKTVQVMTEKGLVTRREEHRVHIYKAAQPEADTQRHLVRDLLNRAFGGSAEKMVMHALTEGDTDAEELARIRKLLDEHSAK